MFLSNFTALFAAAAEEKKEMKGFWIQFFCLLLFLDACNSSSYIFTQYDIGTSLCAASDLNGNCKKGTPVIFAGTNKNNGMNLGFIDSPAVPFHDNYNMTEFGFPIYYEYFPDSKNLKVNIMVSNGIHEENVNGDGTCYYVSLIDEEGKCGDGRPKTLEDTISGGLYLNQKYAKYAYYIYQSSTGSTCILSIKFEDLFQGKYQTKELVYIKAQEIHLLKTKVQNFLYPFFTIDPIFGTMVYLTKNDDEFAAVHYSINENNLTKFEKVFSIPLTLETGAILSYFNEPERMFKNERNIFPVFTSYGKATFMFFFKNHRGGKSVIEFLTPKNNFKENSVIAFWAPKNNFEEYSVVLDKSDDQKHLYFLDPVSFETGEPVGKFDPSLITSSSTSAALTTTTKMSPKLECKTSLYLGLLITFAVIDFILIFVLTALGFLVWLGSKKMKKFHRNKYRPKPSSRRGVTRTTTVTLGDSATAATKQTTVAPTETIAPTNLNTQFTKETIAVQSQGGGEKTTTTNVQGVTQNGQTTARKTTMLQTWES